jgi:hypothetical protein
MKLEINSEARITLPSRPKGSYNEKFKPVQLTSNHYKVNFRGSKNIFIISTKFEPLISDDNRPLRKRIFAAMDSQIRQVITDPVYTGMSIMTANQPNFGT